VDFGLPAGWLDALVCCPSISDGAFPSGEVLGLLDQVTVTNMAFSIWQ
jgi:hypothetical protein